MKDLPLPKDRQRRGEVPGCLLLGGAGFASFVFGAMVLGVQFPNLAWKGFTITCIGFVVAAVLTGLLAAVVEARARREQMWRLDGDVLDKVGEFVGVKRLYLEGDIRYRKRVGEALRSRRNEHV